MTKRKDSRRDKYIVTFEKNDFLQKNQVGKIFVVQRPTAQEERHWTSRIVSINVNTFLYNFKRVLNKIYINKYFRINKTILVLFAELIPKIPKILKILKIPAIC